MNFRANAERLSVHSSFSDNEWKKMNSLRGLCNRVQFHSYVLRVAEALRRVRRRDGATGREALTAQLRIKLNAMHQD